MEDRSRILIVDDELSALYTLEMLLASEPYEIVLANSPEDAFLQLENGPPDVILLDVMMPNVTGFEVCQRLKSDERWRHIPVILVTALNSKEDLVHGLNSGADEFVSKPVNGAELRARVSTMLRIKHQYDEIQGALSMREELANMIVHDMRTPISAILLYLDLLSKAPASAASLERIIPKLQAQAQRLNTMLTDMLLVAKMQSGKLVLNAKLVDMGQLIESAVQDQEAVASTKGIWVETELPNDSRKVPVDSKLMQRALENLLSNALKFSPDCSTVTVRLAYAGDHSSSNGRQPRLCIQVIDEGPGVPKEFHEDIFDRFKVVKVQSAEVPQVGMGLAFCKMVVEAHGGRIWVEANHPTGAVFNLEL